MAAKSRDLARAVNEITKHAGTYRYADKMYRGEVDEVFASSKIANLLKESGKHYRTNLAAACVDAVLNGLEITSVTVPGADGTGQDEALTKIFHERVWEANQLDLYLPDWLLELGKQGDAYLVVWEGETEGSCSVTIRKPIGSRMFYDPEDDRTKDFYAFMWKVGEHTRVNLIYDDRVEKYRTDATNPTSDTDFEEFEEDGDGGWPIKHDYGALPVFHGRTAHPYGTPDHELAFGPQNQLNKLIATSMSTTDFQGFPQRAALMDEALDDDGDAWDGDDEEGTPPTGGIAGKGADDEDDLSRLKASPGSLWMLRNVKSLVSLPAADPDVFLKPLEKAIALMSGATGTPLRFFQGMQGQQPSGASLAEDDKRLNKRIAMRILLASSVLKDAFTFAMRNILGYPDCPEVVITWAPVRRAEHADEWSTVQAKQDAGVPRDVTLHEAGYTPEQTTQWAESSPDPAQGLAVRVELLERLAGAAEKLAGAAGLGALDMSLVQSLMAGFLPAPEEDGTRDAPPTRDEPDRTLTPREKAELVQKVYLGVPGVLSREEARTMLADAGIDIDPDAPAPVE